MEMKYVEDSKTNEKVTETIRELKREMVSRFHPKSIIITGSFGKGEATVFEEGGKIKFLSDCEVLVIPYKWLFNRGKIEVFERDFYRRTGLKVEIWGFIPTLYLLLPFLSKKMCPTIANYDLRYGSKVIHGKDYLERLSDFKKEDISLWEGVRLLLNRMAEALEHFSPENPDEKMLYWTDKIVLACQDALLLSLGEYHPSYKERNRIFMQSLASFEIPSIQTLAKFAIEATNRKLNINPGNRISPSYQINYWFEVRRICDEVFRHVIEKGFNIKFKNYSVFPEKYMNSSLKSYTTLPFNNAVFQNFFRFLKKKIVHYELPTLKMLLKPYIYWDHFIYSSIPLVYFGLENSYQINSNYLNRSAGILRLFGKEIETPNPSLRDWISMKDVVVTYWHQMRL